MGYEVEVIATDVLFALELLHHFVWFVVLFYWKTILAPWQRTGIDLVRDRTQESGAAIPDSIL